ncbi:ABC transporter permease [Reyranella soli]|jgi:lipopolysaccharide transport system permease protein|uniref:Transport permease protein n=1 Tax=Reyranella soli TaxID=1230389 RepID=A0A512NBH3_9HYPH|nr:ABC transporter permease [Reyranella soli]GEP56296.1 transport permease protein [Reyranella soli]
MPSVKVVNGKQIVVEALDPSQRFKRFLAKPLLQMRYNREIILAILRRELASRFTGSAGGWLWAVAAPLFAIAVYTFAFTTKLQMTFVGEQGQKPIAYALFIFAGLIVFNFFSEMAYRSPMLLHEYAHFIKQTIFPSDMLAVISTLRAAAYTGIGAIVMLICVAAVKGGLPWTVIFVPLIFIPLSAFLMGLSWFLSAIGAFTRDAGYLMINIVPLFMFMTPVFFSPGSWSFPWNLAIHGNALTAYVEIMRDLVLTGTLPNPLTVLWALATAIFTFYFGYWFFDRYRNVIVDVI